MGELEGLCRVVHPQDGRMCIMDYKLGVLTVPTAESESRRAHCASSSAVAGSFLSDFWAHEKEKHFVIVWAWGCIEASNVF